METTYICYFFGLIISISKNDIFTNGNGERLVDSSISIKLPLHGDILVGMRTVHLEPFSLIKLVFYINPTILRSFHDPQTPTNLPSTLIPRQCHINPFYIHVTSLYEFLDSDDNKLPIVTLEDWLSQPHMLETWKNDTSQNWGFNVYN